MSNEANDERTARRRSSPRAAARRWILAALISAALCVMPVAVAALLDRMRPPPVRAIASTWRARIDIHDNEPAIRLEMSGEVLRATPSDPARVPLLPPDAVFRDLCVNGKPAVPVRRAGWFCAELKRPGPFMATARLMARPAFDRGDWRLPMARPDFTRATVTIDSDEALDVDAPGHQGRIVGARGRGTHGILTLTALGETAIRWRDARMDAVRAGTPLVTPSVAWVIGDTTLSANALLDVQILDAPLDRIELLLPPGADEVRIGGPRVRDWRRTDRRVAIFFQGARAGRTPVSLSFVVKRAAGASLVTCPEIEVCGGRLDAAGWLLVAKEAGGLLLEQEADGLKDVSDLDVPAPVLGLCRGRPMYLYERTARVPRAVFDHVASPPFPLVETVADRADLLAVIRPGGEEMVRADYLVRNHRSAYLRVRLPADARLLSARVEGKACRPARDGDSFLVPLVRSIQTLNGLVPFPVEVIYCRQGAGGAGSRLVDLPELENVPTAVATATVLCPEETPVRGVEGGMKRVDHPAGRDIAWFRPVSRPDAEAGGGAAGKPSAPAARAAAVTNALAYNYFRAGYEAYQGNKLEEAESLLSRANSLAGDNPLVGHASDLLENIRAGRGEVKGKSRAERAKVATIQEGLAGGNDALQAQQEMLISAGLANIERGDEALGAELLQQADSLGGQIQARHGSARRQESLGQKYKEKQKKTEDDRRKNDSLRDTLAGLQRRSMELIRGWGKEKEGAAKAQRFAVALEQAGARQGLDAYELNREAFGDAQGQASGQQKANITDAARAQTYSRQMSANAANPSGEWTVAQRDKGSLSERNRDLGARVEALGRAIQSAEKSSAAGPETNLPNASLAAAREGTRQAREKVQEITVRLDPRQGQPGATDDRAAARQLDEIGNWAAANSTVYGQADAALGKELKSLREKVESAKEAAARAGEARKNAKTVVLDAAGVVGRDAQAGQKALVRFFGENYAAGQPEAGPAVSISNGKLEVRNAEGNPEIMRSVLENLRANEGQVATVAGAAVAVSSVRNAPVVGGWFTNRTPDGRNYAVLDEAQYRTLIETAPANPAGKPAAARPEQRDVVVGTPNRVAGEAFRLVRSGADYNGFDVGGSQIELPHDKYLVIDNGAYASVIKAGALRNWQEERAAVELAAAPELPIAVPETGTALYFEKTLLGAGESPDIRLIL